MSQNLPPVRIIVLNYNGAGRIERCLESLTKTQYPDLRITVVDNASTDNSVALISHEFPSVELIENGANLGFSRGNNQALRVSNEFYVGLLNPDTIVDPHWLKPLVTRLNEDSSVGGVAPKIIHLHDRLPIRLEVPEFVPRGSDVRRLGVRIYGLRSDVGQAEVTAGAYGLEQDGDGRVFRWSMKSVDFSVPVVSGSGVVRAELAGGDGRHGVPVKIFVGSRELGCFELNPERTTSEIYFDGDAVSRSARSAIESAGISPLPDGSMRDRGTYLLEGVPWSAWDSPAFEDRCEIFAPKGAAVLYRRDMLAGLDYLDDGIFMYYEDADLGWRARRRGWRFCYEPSSVVRHEHAAFSREWSPGFIRNVEFGKLRMLTKNAPILWALRHMAASAKQVWSDARDGALQLDAASMSLSLSRARALTQVVVAAPNTFQLRANEARLAPLDGRELNAFLEPQ
jgi:GT2 family glycosyltransferase